MSVDMRRAGWTVLFLMVALATATTDAQTTSSSRPLSSTVVGSFVARNGQLTLLVLWRGSLGWFLQGRAGGSSGGGGSSSAGREVGSEWFTYGGRSFSIEFDYTAGTAKLLDQSISLTDTNVVLLEYVDSNAGARVVDRLWVDPQLPERPAFDRNASAADQSQAMMRSDPLLVVIRRLPALGSYLQCDLPVPLPDRFDATIPDPAARARIAEYMQGMVAFMCRQAVGP
jgi:hypothetical protein